MAIQMRAQLRAELRQRYQQLKAIPGQRWKTTVGQLFLAELHPHVERYGQRQIAEALGITPQGVSQMLARHDPGQLFGSERPIRTLQELLLAYAAVRRWRDLGRQVRRHHESYRRLHEALSELAVIHPIATIARLSGIRTQELRRFVPDPQPTVVDDVALLVLLEAYDGGRALTSPERRAFLSQLEERLASHPLVDIAHLLGVSPSLMRTWMVEKTHGQHPEEPADP